MGKIYKAPNVEFRYEKLDVPIPDPNGGDDFKFRPLNEYHYYSVRYRKWCSIGLDDLSDGASGAFDIESLGWWVHDMLCKRGCWNNGTKLTNWQCSTVLADILRSEGRFIRDGWWKLATFFGGGGKARENGMFTLKKG